MTTKKPFLEQLFGSKVRVKLLNLFLTNSDKEFFVREITRSIDEQINSVRRELTNLEKMGLLVTAEKKMDGKNRKYYRANGNFTFFKELRSLVLKAGDSTENIIKKRLGELVKAKVVILTGTFVQKQDADTDILVVGDVAKKSLEKIIAVIEKEMGRGLRYSLITEDDYNYRLNMGDQFLLRIMDGEHVVVVKKI